MCDLDGDRDRVGGDDWRRARKVHVCEACGETIRPGDLYLLYRGLSYEGDWYSVKTCARCNAIYRFLLKARPRDYISMLLDCGETWDGTEADHEFALWTRAESQAYAEQRIAEAHR